VSRGDESGTHIKEKEIWKKTGLVPAGSWYIRAGQSMEAVLIMSDEKQAYTLADRGTFIAFEGKIGLRILCEGDSTLFNPYGIVAVNPAKHPHVKYKETMRFMELITSEKEQRMIGGFTKNGKQLFYPNAVQTKVPDNQ
jgi:tungstate transport system substrate-binding protein